MTKPEPMDPEEAAEEIRKAESDSDFEALTLLAFLLLLIPTLIVHSNSGSWIFSIAVGFSVSLGITALVVSYKYDEAASRFFRSIGVSLMGGNFDHDDPTEELYFSKKSCSTIGQFACSFAFLFFALVLIGISAPEGEGTYTAGESTSAKEKKNRDETNNTIEKEPKSKLNNDTENKKNKTDLNNTEKANSGDEDSKKNGNTGDQGEKDDEKFVGLKRDGHEFHQGDILVIRENCFFARDDKAWDKMKKLEMANDKLGLKKMIARSQLAFNSSEVKVRFISYEWGSLKVRILDGRYKGFSGWLYNPREDKPTIVDVVDK